MYSSSSLFRGILALKLIFFTLFWTEMYRQQPERRPSPIQAPPPVPTIQPAVEEHFIERKRPEPEEKEPESDREEAVDRKSRMEQIHAVPTPLAFVEQDHHHREHEKDNNNVHVGGPPAYTG